MEVKPWDDAIDSRVTVAIERRCRRVKMFILQNMMYCCRLLL